MGIDRDDWKHVNDAPDENPGNFLALLQFRIKVVTPF